MTDGKIDIDASVSRNGSLVISIKDDGIGIPKDKIDQLFQPFVQVENVLTRRHKGTGLGLVLVKRLVEFQQGTVQLKSAVRKGTTLILTFPAERVLQPEKEKK